MNAKTRTLFILLAAMILAAIAPPQPARANGTHGTRYNPPAFVPVTHWIGGDCQAVKYHVPPSGAEGYCYVMPVQPAIQPARPHDNPPAVVPPVVQPQPVPDNPPAVTPPQDANPPARECRNPNAGKDGTPDCNAGGGNG